MEQSQCVPGEVRGAIAATIAIIDILMDRVTPTDTIVNITDIDRALTTPVLCGSLMRIGPFPFGYLPRKICSI